MKKELLRINSLSYRYNQAVWLENVTLCILEGECVGFQGLSYSVKNLLVQILTGKIEENLSSFRIFIDGKRILSNSELKKSIYYLSDNNYRIKEWTVAEYIGMVSKGWVWTFVQRNRLETQIQTLMEELNIDLDVSSKLRDLSELEKRFADVVKACSLGAKVLIVEDEFEGMNEKSIQKFANVLKRICTEQRIAVIINSHSDLVMNVMSDKYVIFKKGKIVKKCSKDFIKNDSQMEAFLLEEKITSQKKSFDRHFDVQDMEKSSQNEIVYQIHNFTLKSGKRCEFEFYKGKITTLLLMNDEEKLRLFLVLSGRRQERGVKWSVEYNILEKVRDVDFVQNKIVSVMHLGSREELLNEMTVGENLLLPSLKKISSMEYITSSHKLLKSIDIELEDLNLQMDDMPGTLGINEFIAVTLQRWYTYNPRVLVLIEPFVQCDIYGVSIVKSYLKKFASRGTAVIILKSREEYIEDISDYIISME